MKIRLIPHTENAKKKFISWDGEGGVWDGSTLEGEPKIHPRVRRHLEKALVHFQSFKNVQTQNLMKEGVKPREYTLEVVL